MHPFPRVNIYIIGDWPGTSVPWGLFRYIWSSIGNSLIFFTHYITYILRGMLTGRECPCNGLQDHPSSGGILSVGANALISASSPGKDRVIGVVVFTDGSKQIIIDKTL